MTEQIRKKHGKCDKVLFLHDNARPHTAKLTQKELETLNFELLPHPPYSPDLAPTDYYLFRSLTNQLKEKSFDDFDHLKSTIETFFSNKSPEFYAGGMLQLPVRWRKVVDIGGDYYTD